MRRIAALSLEMRSRSAAFSCLSSSELFNRPPSPTRRVTGFEPTCRAPARIRAPPRRVGADDGAARRIQRGNLSRIT